MNPSDLRQLRISLLGVIGSVPGAGPELMAIGSNTSCMQVMGADWLYFDAGTGILRADQTEAPSGTDPITIHVFLTHYHYDHILGLPFWDRMYQKDVQICIYGPTLSGYGPQEALAELLRTPFLPMQLSDFRATIRYYPIAPGDVIPLNEVIIYPRTAGHPGGGLIYHLVGKDGGPSIGYLTDTDLTATSEEDLACFRHADFIYGDAHFDLETYQRHENWGHSAIEHFLAFQVAYEVKYLALGHHAYHQTLKRLMASLDQAMANVQFTALQQVVIAKEGDSLAYQWQATEGK